MITAKIKKITIVILLILSPLACLYFVGLAIQAVWLSAFPQYDIYHLRKEFLISLLLAFFFLILTIYLLVKIIKGKKMSREK